MASKITPLEPQGAAVEPGVVMPLPSNPQTIFLGGIFILALLTALHVASTIVLPVIVAFIMKLVLQPLLRSIEKLRLPRLPSAMLILALVISVMLALGTMLSGPAAAWAQKLPEGLPRLQERFGFIAQPFVEAKQLMASAENLTKGAGPQVLPVAIQGTRLSDRILAGTGAVISGMFTTMLVLFFLLVSGDTFLRRLVEVLPRFRDKRQAVAISQRIEQELSAYLLTITTVNLLLGVVTAVVMALCGMQDPMLWGALAFLLNYVPIIGPLICAAIIFMAGLLTMSNFWAGVQPAAMYMLLHIIEGSLVTPMLLARRFTLNPVLVILSLVFWYWMWGLPGAILAVPMLAVTKIICDHIEGLKVIGHFLEGEKPSVADEEVEKPVETLVPAAG